MSYPQRIVCLTEETTETLYLLGQGDRVVGVSGYTVRPPEARQMVANGVKARITCVNPQMLDRRFAGREFDAALLDELPAAVDPCAERGEFHTCAYDGPMFSRPIAVETGITVERDGFVFTDLCLTRSASSV